MYLQQDLIHFLESFFALSVDHPLLKELYERMPNFIKFKQECIKKVIQRKELLNAEKEGFFTGVYCINPHR